MKLYSWDEIKDEIIEKLENPTNEQIAGYIEKAYKMGYCKGLDVGIEAFNDLKNKLKYGVKDFKESEGLQ